MDLEWPGRRLDILAALDFLAAEPPTQEVADVDTPWPDLTGAVHWLVDDTSWDEHPARGAIGLILHDVREADAVQAVVDAVVGVSLRQGPAAADAAWFDDEGWPQLRRLAAAAARLLRDAPRG